MDAHERVTTSNESVSDRVPGLVASQVRWQRAALAVLLRETGRHVCKPWVPAWLVVEETRAQAGCTPQAASGALRALLTVGLAARAETERGMFWKPTDAAIRAHGLLMAGRGDEEAQS